MLSISAFTTNTNTIVEKRQVNQNNPKNLVSIIDFKKTQEKYKDFVPKFYTIDFDSIAGRQYVNNYANTEILIDGNLESIKQVKNDCWLLSGINALANTPKGREYIKKALVKTNDGTVVCFKGTNTNIVIPQIVLSAAKQSKKYVEGSDDMLAIELAAEYYKKKLIVNKDYMKIEDPNIVNGKFALGNVKDPLAGGFSSDIMYLITEQKAKTFFNAKTGCSKKIKDLVKTLKDNPEKYAITCNFKERLNGLYIHHAYTIKKIDDEFVTLINPHNSANEEKIPINDFYGNVRSITFLDLESF